MPTRSYIFNASFFSLLCAETLSAIIATPDSLLPLWSFLFYLLILFVQLRGGNTLWVGRKDAGTTVARGLSQRDVEAWG